MNEQATVMTQAKKQKYLTKTVKFGGKALTLFSLDGAVWSSRKDELSVIQERHEAERQKLAQLKPEEGNAESENKPGTESAATDASESDTDDSVVNMSAVSDDDGDETPRKKNAKAVPPKSKASKSIESKAKKVTPPTKAAKKSKPAPKSAAKKKKRAA